jgi:2-keto-4-pentenoate hydratase/2-oxohepta-3-ene-1,7-dioic acid hydratase in catechol pathway
MRYAHARLEGESRLVALTPRGWVDIAAATDRPQLSTLAGLLRAGPAAAVALQGVLGPGPAVAAIDYAQLLPDTTRIFCIGRNYADHRDEFQHAAAPWPEVFLRFGSSIAGPFEDIPRPSVGERVDYEGELAVVIGRPGRHIRAADAMEHVFGYCVANDISVRDWQQRGQQWTSGKNFDRTLPVGPCVLTADEIDGSDLELQTRVNGTVVQRAHTGQLIFDLPTQIEFLSSWTELRVGDLVITGTPGGVGAARTPPLLLVDGDVVEVEIEPIGTIRNRIVDDGLLPATDHWRTVANAVPPAESLPTKAGRT